MLIEWFGHACFRVTMENGSKIVMDPFDSSVGYDLPALEANVVLVSHQHYDHNNTAAVKSGFRLITQAGEFMLDGLAIKGIPSWHDDQHGSLRGGNTVFTMTAEGITVCHMGDQGEIPPDDLLKSIGHVDILMIPVGGTYTLDAAGAIETMEKIRPNITLPMHYKTIYTHMDIAGVHEFLELAAGHYDISRHGANSLNISKDQLKKRPRIAVLECC